MKSVRYSLKTAILAVLVVFCSNIAFAQDSAKKVTEIKIDGNIRIEPSYILSKISVKLGDEVRNKDLNDVLKSVYATGYFSDVSVDIDGKGTLLVRVKESKVIEKIEFYGNDKFSSDDLSSELQSKQKDNISSEKVVLDVKRIKGIYQKSGILDVSVTPFVEELPNNRINLIFKITEGKKAKIRKIIFIGNKVFSKSDLLEIMSISEYTLFRPFSSKYIYDEQKVQFEEENLRKFYLSKGYAEFKVLSITSELNINSKDFDVTINLQEGDKFYFGDSDIKSNVLGLNVESIIKKEKVIKTKKGKLFNNDLVEATKTDISDIISNYGFLFSSVNANISLNKPEKKVNIIYEIENSPRVYINSIRIIGNKKTNDNVIRREILLTEGGIYDTSKLRRSIQRIRNLGYIKDVKVNELKIEGLRDYIDLEFVIEEGSTGSINFSVGYSSFDRFLANIIYSQQNIMGRGYNSSVGVEKSQFRRNISLSFLNPMVFDKNFSIGGSIADINTDYTQIQNFKQVSLLKEINVGYAVSEYLRHSVSMSTRYDEIELTTSATSVDLAEQQGKFRTNILTHSFFYDRRDNAMMPTSGFSTRITQGYANFGGNIKYFSNELAFSFHTKTVSDSFVFSVLAKAGQIRGVGGVDVNIKDRYLFGFNEMRGFDFNGIGPRQAFLDSNGNVTSYGTRGLRGNNYRYISFEQSFPNFLPKDLGFSTYIFYDMGSVYGIDIELNGVTSKIVDTSALRTAYGVGVSWRSPIGPIGFDYGIADRYQAYDQKRTFRLNLGVGRYSF